MLSLKQLKAAARLKHLDVRRDEQVPYQPDFIVPRDFIRMEPWEVEYLYMLGKQAKIGILETGRSKGGSVLTFAFANPSVPIYSIDISPNFDASIKQLMDRCGIGKNVELIVGDSQKTQYSQIAAYDVLLVDGEHTYNGCFDDLTNWWDKLTPGGHVLIHDCYLGCVVQDAVIDFLRQDHIRQNIHIHLSPFIPSAHKLISTGSLCHIQKI